MLDIPSGATRRFSSLNSRNKTCSYWWRYTQVQTGGFHHSKAPGSEIVHRQKVLTAVLKNGYNAMHLALIQKQITYASSNREPQFYTAPVGADLMRVFQAHSFCCVAPVGSANFELKTCKSLFWDKNMAEVQESLSYTRDASQIWKEKKELRKLGY